MGCPLCRKDRDEKALHFRNCARPEAPDYGQHDIECPCGSKTFSLHLYRTGVAARCSGCGKCESVFWP